jgi:hypothetical protein
MIICENLWMNAERYSIGYNKKIKIKKYYYSKLKLKMCSSTNVKLTTIKNELRFVEYKNNS